MKGLIDFLKNWILPIAIALGISSYLLYHLSPALRPIGPACHVLASEGQRLLIGAMLFLQFVKISPHDLCLERWHLHVLAFQVLSFLVFAVVAYFTPEGDIRILLECAMLCLICPTASAAGVITERLGGKLSGTVSYVIIINTVASLLIPAVIPMVRPSAELGFMAYVLRISGRVFPILLLPCVLAWIIRYTCPRLQRWLMRRAHWSFYLWGISLTLAMMLATRALLLSSLGAGTILCIVLVSMGCCAAQFAFGRRQRADRITAGQALGQKNTGFLIWLGYSYMTPVTSVAGGLYAIWQNIFNSWELYEQRHHVVAK